MFQLSPMLGIVAGWLRKGSLLNLGNLPIKYIWLVPVAFGLRVAVSRNALWVDTLTIYGPGLLITSYLLLLVVALANRRLPGMGSLAAGTLLNLLVIFANGGRMPVSPIPVRIFGGQQALNTLSQGQDSVHSLLTPETNLPFLADILYFPPPYPQLEVFSIGDIFICLAIFTLVSAGMRWPLASRTQTGN